MRWLGAAVFLLALAAYLAWRGTGDDADARATRTGEGAERPRADRPPESGARGVPRSAPGDPPSKSPASSAAEFSILTIDGAPIERAQVQLSAKRVPDAGDRAPISGVTDFDGRVLLPGAFAYDVLTVRHALYLDHSAEWAPAEQTTVHLRPGGRIEGSITFSDGRPVPRYPVFDHGAWLATASDDNGRFVVRGVPAGEIELCCDGAEPARISCRAGDRGLSFVLSQSILFVRIVDEEGAPVRGARLGLEGSSHNYSWGSLPESRAIARFDAGADVRVIVQAPGFLAQERVVPAWSRTPAPHEIEVVLTPAPDTVVALRVRQPDGAAPMLVQLTASSIDGSTPPSNHKFIGREVDPILLRGLPRTPHVVRINANNEYLLATEVTVNPSDERGDPIEVVLPAGARIDVGWPDAPRGVEFRLRSAAGRVPVVFNPRAGGFRTLSRVPEGNYTLQAIRSKIVVRDCPVVVRGTDPVEVDWSR